MPARYSAEGLCGPKARGGSEHAKVGRSCRYCTRPSIEIASSGRVKEGDGGTARGLVLRETIAQWYFVLVVRQRPIREIRRGEGTNLFHYAKMATMESTHGLAMLIDNLDYAMYKNCKGIVNCSVIQTECSAL